MDSEYQDDLIADLKSISEIALWAVGDAQKENYGEVRVALKGILDLATGWERDLEGEN